MTLPNSYTVVLDTCVLAPMPLADTLLRLAKEPAFYLPKWSSQTLVELRRVLTTRMRCSGEQADYRIREMARFFPDATVRGYEHIESAVDNDPKDRHVLAAAIASGALAIVTANIRDFPLASLAPHGIEVMTPDEFLLNQFHVAPQRFRGRLADQARVIGFRWDEFLTRLARQAPQCADLLRQDLP